MTKYIEITKDEWVKRGKTGRRITIDGVKHITMFKESIGTYLQPVKIIKKVTQWKTLHTSYTSQENRNTGRTKRGQLPRI